MIKKPAYPLVKVIWLDATGVAEWETVSDMVTRVKKKYYDPVTTLGYKIYEDKDMYIIAQSLTGDCVDNTTCIPRKMVKQVTSI